MDIQSEQLQPWSFTEKLGFRFVFLLSLLFIVFFNNEAYPFFSILMDKPSDALQVFIPWFAAHVLHLPGKITIFTNGSGDTTYDYVCLLFVSALSIGGCLLWTLLDRRSNSYNRLYYWLLVAVRFYVALMLMNYGFAKIFKLQFPSPGPARLTQTYGASSPMGLAWTFLGFSKGYNIFMGIAEVASVLLLFRRTVTLGAIICLMTTANVMAVNYFYDVPVKIVSTALVIFSILLLSPNFKQLFQFFFRGQAAKLNLMPPPAYTKKWIRYALRTVKVLVIAYALYGAYDVYEMLELYGDDALKPTLYGAYNVASFVTYDTAGNPFPQSDTLHWKKFIVQRQGFASVRTLTDSVLSYVFEPDTISGSVKMSIGENGDISHLQYNLTKGQLLLHGRLGRDSISVMMQKIDHLNFRLMNRGFHWVNEHPYNK